MSSTHQRWDGIANGNTQTVQEKQAARLGCDLPEFVDIDLRNKLGTMGEPAQAWRQGLVDIIARDGEVSLKVTVQQSEVWKLVRDDS